NKCGHNFGNRRRQACRDAGHPGPESRQHPLMDRVAKIFTDLGGIFCVSPESFLKKSKSISAFIFDWDGVFNDGTKNENGSSPFGEVDAMGANLLRYSTYLRNGEMPVVAL